MRTPGPWKVTPMVDYYGGYLIHSEKYKVIPEAHDRENAALIEAAEDLLNAVELFLKQYHIPGDSDREARPEIKAALAAVKKARGRR